MQSVLGYRFNKKWSIQWLTVEDFYDRRLSLIETSLGVEYRKNLNNAGYPLFLGTSCWLSYNRFDKRDEHIREQTIVPQLSLSKRVSRFLTFELFAGFPVVIHSNNNNNNKHVPQIGITLYVF